MKLYKNFLMMFAIVAGLSLVACSGEKEEEGGSDEETTQMETPNDNATAGASFTVNVNGMVCNKACPSAIAAGYEGFEGVSDCSAEFSKDDGGMITYTYDPAVTNEAAILEKLASINDGQFTPVAAETTTEG